MKKLNILGIENKDANYWYDHYEVPKDGWVHGRFGQKTLRKNVVILGTQDWDVAEQYAGKQGSLWLFNKKGNTKLVDSDSINFSKKVWDKLNEQYEVGSLSLEMDEYMERLKEESNFEDKFYEELSPEDIVDSAGIWDMMDFVEWFSDNFKYDGVLTEGGGIIILNYNNFDYSKVDK